MSLSRARRHALRQLARGRGEPGQFLLEGPKVIAEALPTGRVLELLLVGPEAPEAGGDTTPRAELIRSAAQHGARLSWMSPSDAQQIGVTVTTQPALAVIADAALTLEHVLRREGMLLWLDGVQDPGNVGAIFRVAAAFGAAGVIIGAGTADPMGPKALRAAVGHSLRVPFARATDTELEAAFVDRAVFGMDARGRSLYSVERPASGSVLVVGSEGQGLGATAQALCSQQVAIPMHAGVESLNVAVSLGVALSWWSGRGGA